MSLQSSVFYYMKFLLIIFLFLILPSCDGALDESHAPIQNLHYCKANFIPIEWNSDHCTTSDSATCCTIMYRSDFSNPSKVSQTEMCFNHATCRWSSVSNYTLQKCYPP